VLEHVHVVLNELESSYSWEGEGDIVELKGVYHKFILKCLTSGKVLPDEEGVIEVKFIEAS
jgi:hypothetical protein